MKFVDLPYREWRGLHIYTLLPVMAQTIQPKSYLEIGVWRGGSMVALVKDSPSVEEVVACDPLVGHCGGPTTPEFLEPLLRESGYKGSLEWLHGKAEDLLQDYLLKREIPFDLAFVDGEHSYDHASHDIRQVVPNTRWTLVHDMHNPSVWDALMEYLYENPLPFMITAESEGTAIIYNEYA